MGMARRVQRPWQKCPASSYNGQHLIIRGLIMARHHYRSNMQKAMCQLAAESFELKAEHQCSAGN